MAVGVERVAAVGDVEVVMEVGVGFGDETAVVVAVADTVAYSVVAFVVAFGYVVW